MTDLKQIVYCELFVCKDASMIYKFNNEFDIFFVI